MLKHHPGKRCTLEIAVKSGGRWHSLVAKICRKDRSDAFQAMQGIQQAGFGPQDEFSISQAFGYAPSLRCLLQEKVDGTPADDIFRDADEPTRAAASVSDVELRAGHGSYDAAHVYLSGNHTVTIDWDWHDVADPARDVARFLYSLRRGALD